jgi:hypothetical protein
MRPVAFAVVILFKTAISYSQDVSYSSTYQNLQQSLAKGWNTSNTENVLFYSTDGDPGREGALLGLIRSFKKENNI